MRTRPLGSSGIQASIVALGTWVMGGWMWGGNDDDDAVRAIHAAIDRGMNFIDTAPIYGFGHSEQIVGRALAALGPAARSRAVIATKCGMVCNTREGRPMARSTALGPSETGHIEIYIFNGPESIRRECEDSLKRLQTDSIDLYQTHWQEQQTPYEDTMAALLKLKDQGKVRAIGVCNATTAEMDRYRAAGSLDSDQEKYSMIDRKLDVEQLPYCREHNIAVLAYSPLALGLLTGKVGPEREFALGDMRRTHRRFTRENRAAIGALLEQLQPIAAAHSCTPAQLAIAWTVHQPGITHALVGARNEAQVAENAAAAAITLSSAEIAQMNTVIAAALPGIVV
ncbi:MAG: aldo/keto reductase [Phycisphaeraceae bacterium]|nr:aldo/keto reductase [Phycisphaeraceae bacterium]